MTEPYQLHQINGAKIVLYPQTHFRGLIFESRLNVGTWNENESLNGVSHLLEHMLYKGNALTPTIEKFEDFLVLHAMTRNGFTSNKKTGYWFYGPGAYQNQLIDIGLNLVFKPSLPETTLAKEKNVVIQEYFDASNSSSWKFYRHVIKALFSPGHPFQLLTLGTPESVSKLSLKDLQSWHQNFYHPANFSLVLGGNFNPLQALDQISSFLNQMPKPKPASPLVTKPTQPSQKNFVFYDKIDQPEVKILFPTPVLPKSDLPARLCRELLYYILGGGPKSLLFHKIRQEQGLVYNIEAYTENWNEELNFLAIEFSTQAKNIPKALAYIFEVTQIFFNSPLNLDLYKEASTFFNQRNLLLYDRLGQIVENMAENLFYYNRILLPEDLISLRQQADPTTYHKSLAGHIDQPKAFIFQILPEQSSSAHEPKT